MVFWGSPCGSVADQGCGAAWQGLRTPPGMGDGGYVTPAPLVALLGLWQRRVTHLGFPLLWQGQCVSLHSVTG